MGTEAAKQEVQDHLHALRHPKNPDLKRPPATIDRLYADFLLVGRFEGERIFKEVMNDLQAPGQKAA